MKLFLSAIVKFLCGVLLVGLLVFLPAWDLNYINGWIFMGVLFVPMFIAGIIMMIKNPALLEKRLDAKETRNKQSIVIKLSGLMFIAGFIVAGLNFRFNWFLLPKIVVIIAALIFLIAYLLYTEILRENSYLSRTIEVKENQKVIDTGLYGIIKHPMYSVTLVLFSSIPLILGSIFSFIIKASFIAFSYSSLFIIFCSSI